MLFDGLGTPGCIPVFLAKDISTLYPNQLSFTFSSDKITYYCIRFYIIYYVMKTATIKIIQLKHERQDVK